jgi:hypothetical protein
MMTANVDARTERRTIYEGEHKVRPYETLGNPGGCRPDRRVSCPTALMDELSEMWNEHFGTWLAGDHWS